MNVWMHVILLRQMMNLVTITRHIKKQFLRRPLLPHHPHLPWIDGRWYIKWLPSNPHELFHKVYRMHNPIFLNLYSILKNQRLLKDTNFAIVEEQLASNFLGTPGQSQCHYCVSQKKFRRSGFTIYHYFNKVLDAILTVEDNFLPYPFGCVRKKSRMITSFIYILRCILLK